MEPYTAEGMARREAEAGMEEGGGGSDGMGDALSPTFNGDAASDSGVSSAGSVNGGSGGVAGAGDAVLESVALEPSPKCINYELVGIVVHSGQANAGHYYSFIKDRR